MNTSGRKEEHVSGMHLIVSEDIGDGVVIHLFLIFLRRDLLGEAAQEFGSLVRSHDIPHLGLSLLPRGYPGGQLISRMDLDREILLGIDELDQERELGPGLSHNLLSGEFRSILFHNVCQRLPGERAILDHRHMTLYR